jgi:hypothetical protein
MVNMYLVAGGSILGVAIAIVVVIDILTREKSTDDFGMPKKNIVSRAWSKLTGCDDDKSFMEDCEH